MFRARLCAALSAAVLLLTLCACTAAPKTAGKAPDGSRTPESSRDGSASENALEGLASLVSAEDRDEYDFTEKAMEYLGFIAENYPDRSEEGHDAFGDWLRAELENCGYASSQIEEQSFNEETVWEETVTGRNIILTVPGKRADRQIIAGAHYDGTGIGDNGSGTALLLATAAGLSGTEPEFTWKFIFFDREEEGKVGSRYYAGRMSEEEIASTVYMVNLDALAFGDFCNIYGGSYGEDYDLDYFSADGEEAPQPEAERTEGYLFAADTAERLGFTVYRPEDLDGYYAKHGRGMEPEEGAFFTNPWTYAHPAPECMEFMGPSPTTIGASDHAPFAVLGIPYIYFEATNWWAGGEDSDLPYVGYIETYDLSLGEGGMFMNTDCDTLENLNALFPGRAEAHYRLYSPLLSALLLVEER